MPFTPNEKVQLANDPSRVGIVERLGPLHAGTQYYHVFWGGTHGTGTIGEFDLRPMEVIATPADSLIAGRFGGYPEFQRLITLQRLVRDQPLRNNVYAFNASRTQFFPYQFKPLLKFLESPRHRLLICDEVGLGKTIEAGLIMLELQARQALRLVLVVCPSNLRGKWRLELKQRFGQDFRILQSRELTEFLDEYEEAPERVGLNGIVSMETLRGERIRERLDELSVPFDLVIFDEAHHLRNFGTAQRAAGEATLQAAQAAIMLTATPVHLGQENLFSLLNLLDNEDFRDRESAADRFRDNEHVVQAQAALARLQPDLGRAVEALEKAARSPWLSRGPLVGAVRDKLESARRAGERDGSLPDRRTLLDLQRDLAEVNLLGHILTRTRKRDVQEDVAVRRAQAHELALSGREQEFYDAVTALIRAQNDRSNDRNANSQWLLTTPQRRMASSIQGMVEFYRETGHLDVEGDDPDGFDGYDESRQISEANEEELRARLRDLVRGWPADGPDAKYECLRDVLRELESSGRARKVIVFATFKHTIRYLKRRLPADGINVAAISGDTPIDERPLEIARFRDRDDVTVLISSRVGSEGLDFQFCSALVNYDLPWNPMEVEQRIGRLDRIGQRAPSILIVNLWTKGTIEERILRRLYDRIGIFETAIGDLEAILGDITSSLQKHLVQAALMPEEVEEAVEKTARAIEERRNSIESLEASAAQFVGVDAFFEEEVASIRSRRRYVTGVQLHRFLADFLRNEAPRSRLEYDFETNTGWLSPDEQLKQFLRRSGRAGEALSVAGAVGGSIAVTFDSGVAFREPGFEFLSVVHPLIIAIAEHHQRSPQPASAQHVLLRTSTLPPGFYFFFVFRLRVKGARPFNSLETVVLAEDLTLALDSEGSEAVLGEMAECGSTPADPIELPREVARMAVDRAQELFLERLDRLRALELISNSAFVEQRLASVRSYYEKGIHKKRDLLSRGVLDSRKEQYLRMLKGHITRLEGELHRRETDLEQQRHFTTEHDSIATGILEVAPGESGQG